MACLACLGPRVRLRSFVILLLCCSCPLSMPRNPHSYRVIVAVALTTARTWRSTTGRCTRTSGSASSAQGTAQWTPARPTSSTYRWTSGVYGVYGACGMGGPESHAPRRIRSCPLIKAASQDTSTPTGSRFPRTPTTATNPDYCYDSPQAHVLGGHEGSRVCAADMALLE